MAAGVCRSKEGGSVGEKAVGHPTRDVRAMACAGMHAVRRSRPEGQQLWGRASGSATPSHDALSPTHGQALTHDDTNTQTQRQQAASVGVPTRTPGLRLCPRAPRLRVLRQPRAAPLALACVHLDCALHPMVTCPCRTCASHPMVACPCRTCALHPMVACPCRTCASHPRDT